MNKPLKWIISNSLFILPLLIVLVATNVAVSVCTVIFALLSKNAVNAATTGNMDALLKEGIILAVVILIEIALRVINSRMTVSFGGRMEMRMREKVFSSVLNKSWSEVSSFHSGEVVNRIKSDTSVIASGIMHILPHGAMFISRIIMALFVLFTIDLQFALIICIISPLLLLFGRLYSKKMKFFHKEVQKSEGSAISYMIESIQNLTVVKAFGSEKNAEKTLKAIQKETLSLRLKRNAWSILANVSMMLLFTGGYAFTILWGAFRIAKGQLSFGDFTAMIQLVNQVQSPAKSMGSLLVTYQNMLASAERILEFEALTEDVKSPKAPPALFEDFSEIVFDSVSFSYGGDKILDSANMCIHKGEFVALCGISGSGKSTIIRLLLSLIKPDEGEIYIQGDEKHNITSSLRPLFGYVPQGNLLISGTIADNIAFYSPVSEEDILRASRIAQMDFALNLPMGLATPLGEKGSGLSEGQIQRIAIARAIARKNPVLLLDEATSALDEETEIRLLDALKAEKDKTVIIITHRKKVLDYCDKILTLTDGKLRID
ncbi:MAG: ABC transporter ATP-binding protein [Clostridia bacterium]|nr:ABC transporter ATP-binding protein [Clostridia bacterium]